MRVLLIVMLLSLTACQLTDKNDPKPLRESPPAPVAKLSERSLHNYSMALTNTMIANMQPLSLRARIAVGSFLPAEQLEHGYANEQQHVFALQMQESLQTLFVQLGAQVVEIRTLDEVTLADNQERMLSRNVEKLQAVHQLDYFLTGTFNPVQSGYLINAKLIAVGDKRVVAAATELVPHTALWGHEKVQLRNGLFYRSEN